MVDGDGGDRLPRSRGCAAVGDVGDPWVGRPRRTHRPTCVDRWSYTGGYGGGTRRRLRRTGRTVASPHHRGCRDPAVRGSRRSLGRAARRGSETGTAARSGGSIRACHRRVDRHVRSPPHPATVPGSPRRNGRTPPAPRGGSRPGHHIGRSGHQSADAGPRDGAGGHAREEARLMAGAAALDQAAAGGAPDAAVAPGRPVRGRAASGRDGRAGNRPRSDNAATDGR